MKIIPPWIKSHFCRGENCDLFELLVAAGSGIAILIWIGYIFLPLFKKFRFEKDTKHRHFWFRIIFTPVLFYLLGIGIGTIIIVIMLFTSFLEILFR